MPPLVQKGLTWRPSRRLRASLVRTSISGPTRAQVSYAFDTAVVTEKFPIRCHNPLNVGCDVLRAGDAVPTRRLADCRRPQLWARVQPGTRRAGATVSRSQGGVGPELCPYSLAEPGQLRYSAVHLPCPQRLARH